MLTHVAARDSLVSYFDTSWSAAYPSVPVFYDNRSSVSLDTVGDTFVKVSVEFTTANQASIDTSPISRVRGIVFVTLMAREGTGTRDAFLMMDFLFSTFKYKNLSGVQVGCPHAGHRETRDGWRMQEVAVPFWFDAA